MVDCLKELVVNLNRLTEEIRYNPLYARDGDMGLKGTYAGIPALITKTLPHEFDHLTMSRGDRSIFDESVGGGLDSIEAYRDTRLNDIARDLDTAEKLRTQRTNADRLFTNMGKKGALEEFTDIGRAVDDYVDNSNFNSISQALKSANYPSYKSVLKQNLDDTFGISVINVSRPYRVTLQILHVANRSYGTFEMIWTLLCLWAILIG